MNAEQREIFSIKNLDLSSTDATNGVAIGRDCFELVYLMAGSDPGGVLQLDGIGLNKSFRPGQTIKVAASQIPGNCRVQRAPGSTQSGNAALMMILPSDVDLREQPRGFPIGSLGNPTGGGIGPAGALTQAAGAAAFGVNKPTAATDGVPLSGVTGIRAILNASAGNTISAVTAIQWWQFDTASQLWGPSDMADGPFSFGAGNAKVWVPVDKQMWVPEGRAYGEVIGFTDSGGGAATLRIATWGA